MYGTKGSESRTASLGRPTIWEEKMGQHRATSLIGITIVALTAGLLQSTPASASTYTAMSLGDETACAVVSGAATCWG